MHTRTTIIVYSYSHYNTGVNFLPPCCMVVKEMLVECNPCEESIRYAIHGAKIENQGLRTNGGVEWRFESGNEKAQQVGDHCDYRYFTTNCFIIIVSNCGLQHLVLGKDKEIAKITVEQAGKVRKRGRQAG